MAKGARLYPLQVTKLYEKIVGIVDSKRKTPTRFYYKVKGGKNYIERYTDEQIWCRDFLTFVRNREDFERFLNDIADSQWMSERLKYLPLVNIGFILKLIKFMPSVVLILIR